MDLHETSDIRFVMIEVGKLTIAVEFLTNAFKDQGAKLDALRTKASWLVGGVVVGTFFLLAFGGFLVWLFSAHGEIFLEVLKALGKVAEK